MLLECLYQMKLSGPLFKMMIYLIRRTHGETGMNKKGDWLSHTIKSQREVARYTGQNQSQISKAITALDKLNLLEIISTEISGIKIRLNMKLDEWESADVKAYVTKWINNDIRRRKENEQNKLQKETDKKAKAEKKRKESYAVNGGLVSAVNVTNEADTASVTKNRYDKKLTPEDEALLAELATM